MGTTGHLRRPYRGACLRAAGIRAAGFLRGRARFLRGQVAMRADMTDGTVGVMSEPITCSAKGCQAAAVYAVIWNNPKIHPSEREKTWMACADTVNGSPTSSMRVGCCAGWRRCKCPRRQGIGSRGRNGTARLPAGGGLAEVELHLFGGDLQCRGGRVPGLRVDTGSATGDRRARQGFPREDCFPPV